MLSLSESMPVFKCRFDHTWRAGQFDQHADAVRIVVSRHIEVIAMVTVPAISMGSSFFCAPDKPISDTFALTLAPVMRLPVALSNRTTMT